MDLLLLWFFFHVVIGKTIHPGICLEHDFIVIIMTLVGCMLESGKSDNIMLSKL